MANTTNKISNVSDIPDYSVWGVEFNMEAFRADPARWNKDWEKALLRRPASDVLTRMGGTYRRYKDSVGNGTEMGPILTEQLVGIQELLADLWTSAVEGGGYLTTAWLLLKAEERTRYLNKGFEDSYSRAAARQDARCLAPEITTSALLKRNGKGFVEFIDLYVKGKKDVGVGKPYFHKSEWWDKALEGVLESFPGDTFEILTLQRNDFMSTYLFKVTMSVFKELRHGSAGMNPIITMLKNDSLTAASLAKTLSDVHEEPIVCCQNCEKQEEVGKKFMLCSTCKSKLNFPIHYCSIDCQREDWCNHKKHCGKEKIAKKLAGTIHDPYWFQPEIPDDIRNLPVDSRGDIKMSSLGFGGATRTLSYSPALQRQVNLLTSDRDADYFLFDESDRPMRFVINDRLLKMGFRGMRADAFSGAPKGVGIMLEYILKVMERKPGLSRRGIITQFTKEYERDVGGDLADFEGARKGSGVTILESVARGLSTLMTRG